MNLMMICSIILGLCFLVILLYNIKFKNKIINYLFIFFELIFLLLIILLDSKFIYQFLKAIITYIWYPNYLIFIVVIFINIINMLISLLNNKKNNIIKIINYLLFAISFICYISFLELDININLYSRLYQNSSLILMRIVSISTLVGTIIKFIIGVGGKYEK